MENTIEKLIRELHSIHASCKEGALADYIPELTKANPDWYGISVVTMDGHQYCVGDTDKEFTIQSVSKAFTYGMILDDYGMEFVETKIGVEPSGEAFNSISLDPGTGRPKNPMINAGAIAATGQIKGDDADARFDRIISKFSSYAARDLQYDEAVYRSESATGHRNRAISYMLRNFDIIEDPVNEHTEVYFKQCSILVNCRDLAVMGACLANNGTNPVTGERVLKMENVDKVLSVMSTCGMYDYSGTWIYEVGLPAKSGVGGGVVGVLPGQLGIAVFSPLLDPKGNSVRGIRTFRDLSKRFNLHLFKFPSAVKHAIRRVYDLSQVTSTRRRPADQAQCLREHGGEVRIFEMQGDMFTSSLERLIRAMGQHQQDAHCLIIDLRRSGLKDCATDGLILKAARSLIEDGKTVLVVDPQNLLDRTLFHERDVEVLFSNQLDDALEYCENRVIQTHLQTEPAAISRQLREFPLFQELDDREFALVEPLFETVEFPRGHKIISKGDPANDLYLVGKGAVSVTLQQAEDKAPERLAAFYAGVVFGEMAMIENKPRSADVWADRDTLCYRLSIPQLQELRPQYPEIYTKLILQITRDLSDRLRTVSQEVALLKGVSGG